VKALYVTLAAWAALELVVRVREVAGRRGGRSRDRFTRDAIVLAIGGAIAGSVLVERHVTALRMRGPHVAAGLVVMWAGLAIRAWAIAALGRSFRTTVEVDAGQRVVTAGPYRWVRHPSYSGLYLILIGFGLGLGNWLSLAVCVALPLPALLRRISVEEAELTRVLGEPYRAYRTRTKRLVPGVW
jgi:protein-S-isoprenylcysteine O-methyltransferase Ste14